MHKGKKNLNKCAQIQSVLKENEQLLKVLKVCYFIDLYDFRDGFGQNKNPCMQ